MKRFEFNRSGYDDKWIIKKEENTWSTKGADLSIYIEEKTPLHFAKADQVDFPVIDNVAHLLSFVLENSTKFVRNWDTKPWIYIIALSYDPDKRMVCFFYSIDPNSIDVIRFDVLALQQVVEDPLLMLYQQDVFNPCDIKPKGDMLRRYINKPSNYLGQSSFLELPREIKPQRFILVEEDEMKVGEDESIEREVPFLRQRLQRRNSLELLNNPDSYRQRCEQLNRRMSELVDKITALRPDDAQHNNIETLKREISALLTELQDKSHRVLDRPDKMHEDIGDVRRRLQNHYQNVSNCEREYGELMRQYRELTANLRMPESVDMTRLYKLKRLYIGYPCDLIEIKKTIATAMMDAARSYALAICKQRDAIKTFNGKFCFVKLVAGADGVLNLQPLYDAESASLELWQDHINETLERCRRQKTFTSRSEKLILQALDTPDIKSINKDWATDRSKRILILDKALILRDWVLMKSKEKIYEAMRELHRGLKQQLDNQLERNTRDGERLEEGISNWHSRMQDCLQNLDLLRSPFPDEETKRRYKLCIDQLETTIQDRVGFTPLPLNNRHLRLPGNWPEFEEWRIENSDLAEVINNFVIHHESNFPLFWRSISRSCILYRCKQFSSLTSLRQKLHSQIQRLRKTRFKRAGTEKKALLLEDSDKQAVGLIHEKIAKDANLKMSEIDAIKIWYGLVAPNLFLSRNKDGKSKSRDALHALMDKLGFSRLIVDSNAGAIEMQKMLRAEGLLV
ncbi:MAG: hypothetical protein ACO2ZM_01315 [Francisellaceae bacterium]